MTKSCSLEGCDSPRRARGFCTMHYQRWKKHGDATVNLAPKGKQLYPTCALPGCDRPHDARGLCKTHYNRWVRHGDTARRTLSPTEVPLHVLAWRVLTRVKVTQRGCWEFQGSRNKAGYGQVQTGRRTKAGNRLPRQTHTITYEFIRGPVPPGKVLDHFACDNPPCCNPWHLRPATRWENTRRGRSPVARHARQTECKRGHAFTEENTYRDKQGHRQCRTCHREWARDPESMRESAA